MPLSSSRLSRPQLLSPQRKSVGVFCAPQSGRRRWDMYRAMGHPSACLNPWRSQKNHCGLFTLIYKILPFFGNRVAHVKTVSGLIPCQVLLQSTTAAEDWSQIVALLCIKMRMIETNAKASCNDIQRRWLAASLLVVTVASALGLLSRSSYYLIKTRYIKSICRPVSERKAVLCIITHSSSVIILEWRSKVHQVGMTSRSVPASNTFDYFQVVDFNCSSSFLLHLMLSLRMTQMDYKALWLCHNLIKLRRIPKTDHPNGLSFKKDSVLMAFGYLKLSFRLDEEHSSLVSFQCDPACPCSNHATQAEAAVCSGICW